MSLWQIPQYCQNFMKIRKFSIFGPEGDLGAILALKAPFWGQNGEYVKNEFHFLI